MRLGVDDQISSCPLARDAGIGHVNRELYHSLPLVAGVRDEVIWYANARSESVSSKVRVRRSCWPTSSSAVRVLWQQIALPASLREDSVDVLLGTAFVLPLLTGVPSVLIVHDLFSLRHPEAYRGGLRAAYLSWMIRRSCHRAGAVVCSSASTRRDLLELVPGLDANKVFVALLGFDADGWQKEMAELPEGRAFTDKPYILCTGTVEPKKNLLFLVQLFEESEWLRQTFDLVVVGKCGWGQEDLERRMSSVPWIKRLGYLERSQLLQCYRDAACLAFPSLGEGFGYPAVEAMASGIPVVASDRGSLPEVCGEAALVVPLHGQSWLEAFRVVGQNEYEKRRLGEAGRQRAREFTWGSYAEQIWECARQIHGRHPV